MRSTVARIPAGGTPKPRISAKLQGARVVAAGEFKAKCLALLDEVNQTGQEIEITKRGKTVARLIAPRNEKPVLFGRMKGTIQFVGDVIGPTGEVWDAER